MSKANPKTPRQDLRFPERPYGSFYDNPNLRSSVSIVGLGCSSFSTFFWSDDDWEGVSPEKWSVASLEKSHCRVQEWIRAIEYAILEAGITLLDTAPWYGHGTSEVVIGWAMEELSNKNFLRDNLTINTKVGRYEADPNQQFDFSAAATLASVQRSLQRLQCCGYIDVLQVHDPEFAPSIELLFQETIPTMLKCQDRGWCRALGMTGYPLEVQHQILQRSMEVYGRNIWDQSLTYGHFNLHDGSLINSPVRGCNSFADYCADEKIVVLSAAPLSMGLLTERGPPPWHPASDELKDACVQAVDICHQHGVDIASLALLMALSHPDVPCTIVGMESVAQVQTNCSLARRFCGVEACQQEEILRAVLSSDERMAWETINDSRKSPFANLWKNGGYKWDGVKEAQIFWKQLNDRDVSWQRPSA